MTVDAAGKPTGSLWLALLGTRVDFLGNRYRTRVIENGEGHPLVLLHGNGGHAESYARNVRRLGAAGYRAMAIDLLWHGLSSKPAFEPDMVPAYARQILDLLDSEGIEKAHFEGESLGGWVCLWLALHHSDRVGRLVLNTTAGIRWKAGSVAEDVAGGREALRARSLDALRNPSREKVRRRLEWLVADPALVTDELVELRHFMMTEPTGREARLRIAENSFGFGSGARAEIDEARLADVAAETLVLWTDHNPGHGPDTGRRIAGLIPRARFRLIEDAAHWPQWERPLEHDRAVIGFLDGALDDSPKEQDA
ncbi:alpha/beta fold hydrolase [Actinomadura decatromicini]|uniref:Alpha/beta fold hydrolase n=1 Tax=Actinomadura decatromicini TaxID=2604572 RepID=A0A5D3FTL9_9ACTN|nr:alpha/beta fold hydrolase [Actinomadura decatromicini]TYK51412.1 alpha/beta fold hydrolase [Actinomadura decatromicini]